MDEAPVVTGAGMADRRDFRFLQSVHHVLGIHSIFVARVTNVYDHSRHRLGSFPNVCMQIKLRFLTPYCVYKVGKICLVAGHMVTCTKRPTEKGLGTKRHGRFYTEKKTMRERSIAARRRA